MEYKVIKTMSGRGYCDIKELDMRDKNIFEKSWLFFLASSGLTVGLLENCHLSVNIAFILSCKILSF